MFFAFFRLFFIAAATIVSVVLVIIGLRLVGQKQSYSLVPHPFLNQSRIVVAWGGSPHGVSAPFSAQAYKTAADEDFVLGLDLRLSRDGVWYISPDKYLANHKDFLTHKNSDELDKEHLPNSTSPILRFDSLVHQMPKSRYYIVVDNPASPYLEALFKTIESLHIEEQIILSSPFADTTKFLRERSAKWLTDSTTAEIAKAKLLTSLFLESLITTTGEVMTLDRVNEPLMRELRKRHMAVLFKTDDASLATRDLFDKDLITGIVTSRPSHFVSQ